jgi:hypothetical protein
MGTKTIEAAEQELYAAQQWLQECNDLLAPVAKRLGPAAFASPEYKAARAAWKAVGAAETALHLARIELATVEAA